jgi:hypothetical protein
LEDLRLKLGKAPPELFRQGIKELYNKVLNSKKEGNAFEVEIKDEFKFIK